MGTVQTALLGAFVLSVAYYFSRLYTNYLSARKLGIPIVVLPLDNMNPLSYLFSRAAHRFLTRLGFPEVLRRGHLAWSFNQKAAPLLEWNCTAIVQVTPGSNWICLADPVGATQMYAAERRGDIARPGEAIKMLEVFGPNISTAMGADYTRMKKVTATSFNEGTNRTVWAESLRQGDQMVASWLAKGEQGVRSTADATRQVAMNIMLRAGFGKMYDFVGEKGKEEKREGEMDFREAIEIVIANAVAIIGIGPERLPTLGKVFGAMEKFAIAVKTFKGYMTDMIDQGYKEGQEVEGKSNLLGALVKALHEEKQLSEMEVYGNCFVFLFGGHDTTAHSLAFTFVLLSIHPEFQEWMREELRRELDGDDYRNWKYETHPNLKRTLAIQLETIRLYSPLIGVSKGVPKDRTCQLSFDGGKTLTTVPGGTKITIETNALHTLPEYWGEDALEWKPSRWIQTDEEGNETLWTPEKGTYYGWSDGLKACPGKKFGHLEHVAVMAAVFRNHAVYPKAEKGESPKQTTERIQGVIADSGPILNNQMLHPENACLVWERC